MDKLVFDGYEITKKEFNRNKQGIRLNDIIVKNIVVSNKVKINDKIVKSYIGYIIDDNVIPLILLLPVISRWIKYSENGGKNMRFKIENDNVYVKYNNIWNKIKDLLNGIKLSNDIIYDDKYIKTKGKTFENVKTLFSNNIIPKEWIECECIPCISLESVLKIKKK